MNIEMITKETEMTVLLDGRLDTTTAPELEQKLAQGLDSVAAITLDFTKLRYISSAGLRVLLSLQKKMNAAGGSMVVKNPNELIMDVFDATGFVDVLTIVQEG
ncbi:MAG: STAS domain-containing protein [Lachnospiraceae bacterium]|nr:STAS domain-containing protein [Lachnospiraceae bacterium]